MHFLMPHSLTCMQNVSHCLCTFQLSTKVSEMASSAEAIASMFCGNIFHASCLRIVNHVLLMSNFVGCCFLSNACFASIGFVLTAILKNFSGIVNATRVISFSPTRLQQNLQTGTMAFDKKDCEHSLTDAVKVLVFQKIGKSDCLCQAKEHADCFTA